MKKMITHGLRRLLGKSPSEFDRLIYSALAHPRYTNHQFGFRHLKFEVTDFLSVAYQLKEYYGDDRMKFTSDAPTPVIIDCGANVGVSVIYFKQLYPNSTIIAFEPDQKVFNCLQKNLAANHIQNVELVQKAVWIDNNGVNFGSEGADGGSVFHSANKNLVPSIRLKDVLKRYDKIDLLKIDIEGAEVEVLLDCQDELGKVKNLFVEYHSWSDQTQRLQELLAVLTKNSFRYYIHSIGKIHKSPFVKVDDDAMDVQLDIHAIRR
jgi:FkbM family methyltransferase